MLILGIESSCDDTAASVIESDKTLLSNIISSQDEIHTQFGGVVPELASRQHLAAIHPVVEKALKDANTNLTDIDLISVTQGPGLIGSLLIGFSYAKSLSYASKTPYIGVDHMAGHLLAIFLEEHKPSFPYIGLIVSGGTSSIYLVEDYNKFTLLGRTRDDAAGEAFDKVGKLLGFDYPAGPTISKLADQGTHESIKFPRAWLDKNSYDFSFSGLKTAVLNHHNREKQRKNTINIPDICASFQEAVVDVLVEKTYQAAKHYDVKTIVIGGGVASNPRLREAMNQKCKKEYINFHAPSPIFCTDNAAMIAMAGYHKWNLMTRQEQEMSTVYNLDVYSRSNLGI